MTSDTYTGATHEILVVSCNCDLPDDARGAAQAYTFCSTVKTAISIMAHTGVRCVLACIDPFEKDSLDQLKILRDRAAKENIAFATLSQFNPVWIENLLGQFGVKHISRAFRASLNL